MTSFGYQRQERTMINDSIVLNAYLYSGDEETLVPLANITEVTFTVLVPGDDLSNPTIDHCIGTVVADGHGQFMVDSSINGVQGQYKSYAQFTYDEGDLVGLRKSAVTDYDVFDPFVRAEPSAADAAIDQCWMKIEDCFDSEIGGPWLRDMTLAIFDKTKINGFIPEVLLEINQKTPFTDYDVNGFPYLINDGAALFAEGLLLSTVRHLMRSYTEQPDVTGSPVGFLDRRRYQQSWKAIYDVEMERFNHWLIWWKRRSYDLDHSALLVGNKAGRMMPAPMRSRNVGRGFGQ